MNVCQECFSPHFLPINPVRTTSNQLQLQFKLGLECECELSACAGPPGPGSRMLLDIRDSKHLYSVPAHVIRCLPMQRCPHCRTDIHRRAPDEMRVTTQTVNKSVGCSGCSALPSLRVIVSACVWFSVCVCFVLCALCFVFRVCVCFALFVYARAPIERVVEEPVLLQVRVAC
eukprot:COSAG06_NODE_4033_length_4640_cov_3.482713_4_plen_173_part_00